MSLFDRDLTQDISQSNQSYVRGSSELATGSGVGITGSLPINDSSLNMESNSSSIDEARNEVDSTSSDSGPIDPLVNR